MRNGKFAKLCTLTTVVTLAGGILLPAVPQAAHADRGIVDLWKAIKPLTTIASAMNTGAHPDDEHSATLAYLSLGRGVDTFSVIANRGEGGQNEIGSELGNALGIIRTRELQEASKVTNVHLEILSQQIDDSIYDFGFSKSPDETLEKWGEEVAYERLIRTIRTLRPDVLIPSFLNEPSTHGHHRAINIMTVRAFHDAADPAVFPAHLREGLSPWQVKKLYLPAGEDDYSVRVPVGDYDERYGASYTQLGEESRFLHRSQGMGRHYDEGPRYSYYKLEQSAAAAAPVSGQEADFFDGIAFTFDDLAREVTLQPGQGSIVSDLRKLQREADQVIDAFPRFADVAREVHQMLATVQGTIARVQASGMDETVKRDLLHRLAVKEQQLNKASLEALSLVVKLRPDTTQLVAGQTTRISVTAFNGGRVPVEQVQFRLNLPSGWQAKPIRATNDSSLGYNQTVTAAYEVSVPADALLFAPYAPAAVTADVTYRFAGSAAKTTISPADPVAVLPAFAMELSPGAAVLNTLKPTEPIPVKVTVRNYTPGAARTNISLLVPDGWSVEPQTAPLAFSGKGETLSAAFTVTAAANVAPGTYTIPAVAAEGGKQSRHGAQIIHYPHIGTTYFVKPAALTIQAFDLQVPEGLKVGYVSSGFDDIDQYLQQFGIDVTQLTAKDIESGDLDVYDTIVLGIRAYGFRPELISSNGRLLKYVEDGGNLVVQYHKPEDNWKPELAPYPIRIGTPLIQWRVTDENAPVTMLAPDHPLFNSPNKITAEDWDNWIQDRSAYNPAEWGDAYTELISNGDPGEEEFTGTYLTAAYGKGTYTYSSLVWYREIPALVPGAIRMFVNMVSLKQ